MTKTNNNQEEQNKLLEMRKKLDEDLEKRKEILHQDVILFNRSQKAKSQIMELEEKIKKLKEERPKLLADGKDVSQLNKKLKKFNEQIGICEDTIKGIDDKRKEVKDEIYVAKQNANFSYVEYIQEIIQTLKKDYLKTATEFAKILTEMLALNNMCASARGYRPPIAHPHEINIIPDPYDNKKEIFRNNPYTLEQEHRDKLRKKYNIPEYSIDSLKFL